MDHPSFGKVVSEALFPGKENASVKELRGKLV